MRDRRKSASDCGPGTPPASASASEQRGLTLDLGHAESSIMLGKRDDSLHGQEELLR